MTKLLQVNIRLKVEDIEEAKKRAQEDLTSYHKILREAVSIGLKKTKQVVK